MNKICTIAIIVSAGKGKRFKTKIPKQYLEVNNNPLISYTLSAFNSHPMIDGIILVAAGDKLSFCKQIVKKYNFNKVLSVVKGGDYRSHSVFSGLKAVPKKTKIVLVHDGVRPVISSKLIKKVILAAEKNGASIAAIPPKNTIKEITGKWSVKTTLDRNKLIEVQTPQAFKYDVLMDAYKKLKGKLHKVTDDSSLVEALGIKVKAVKGEYNNIKVTTEEDLNSLKSQLQSTRLQNESYDAGNDWRIGIGYDIHRLVEKRKLILGGVKIKSDYGLLGHSDADVLLHAITDAILGSISGRDIGWHFPDTEAKYKGAPSSTFLKKSQELLIKKGYKIGNIDSIIIAQKPKLQPYYKKIVSKISKLLSVAVEDITVKFTTAEELGPIGNSEAIAAMAVVTILKE